MSSYEKNRNFVLLKCKYLMQGFKKVWKTFFNAYLCNHIQTDKEQRQRYLP